MLDNFIELARIDLEEAKKPVTLSVLGDQVPVVTRLDFTKFGRARITAEVTLGTTVHSGEGETKEAAVTALTEVVRSLGYPEEKQDREAKFCCITCGTRFVKEFSFPTTSADGLWDFIVETYKGHVGVGPVHHQGYKG